MAFEDHDQEIEQILLDAGARSARICFYYPQYTLEEAVDMPYGDARLLLRQIRREKLLDYHMNLAMMQAVKNGRAEELANELVAEYEKLSKAGGQE